MHAPLELLPDEVSQAIHARVDAALEAAEFGPEGFTTLGWLGDPRASPQAEPLRYEELGAAVITVGLHLCGPGLGAVTPPLAAEAPEPCLTAPSQHPPSRYKNIRSVKKHCIVFRSGSKTQNILHSPDAFGPKA